MAEQWPPARGLPGKRRFKKARDLRWGETPFDDLNRAELLRLVQAYHSAAVSARSILRIGRIGQETSPYWSREGSGGRALAKLDHLVTLCGDGGMNAASERIYRSFFRSAIGLLFPGLKDKFDDWGVNDKGEWIAPNPGPERGFRPVRWSDLLPLHAADDGPDDQGAKT